MGNPGQDDNDVIEIVDNKNYVNVPDVKPLRNNDSNEVQITGLNYFENDVHNALDPLRDQMPYCQAIRVQIE